MKLGVVIYSYDKTEEACIQMEIIRYLRSQYFDDIKIVHCFNGDKESYPQKYLEDELIYLDNPGHYEGAANMMDVGVGALLSYDIDFLVINASDIWWIEPEKMKKILLQMQEEKKVIGSCPWWFEDNLVWQWVGLACDMFFIDAEREKKYHIFPLQWKSFYDKYIDFIRFMGKRNVLVEALLASKYLSACEREMQALGQKKDSFLWAYAEKKVFLIKERIPVLLSHTERRFNVPELGLFTDHNIQLKKELLKNKGLNLWYYSKKWIAEIL